jgi:hypothetical protein
MVDVTEILEANGDGKMLNFRRLAVLWAARSLVFLFAGMLSVFGSAKADTILVGTVVDASVEEIGTPTTPGTINYLIDQYNSYSPASLPYVLSKVNKLDETADGSPIFENGSFDFDDFKLYKTATASTGTRQLSIFNNSDQWFEDWDFTAGNVLAFEQITGPSFDYYVSKDGNLGWSLWTHMPGALNPVYTDSGVEDFTRGAISDNGLDYDPIGNEVSHLSFYTSVPAPSAIAALLGMGALGLITIVRRSRRRA